MERLFTSVSCRSKKPCCTKSEVVTPNLAGPARADSQTVPRLGPGSVFTFREPTTSVFRRDIYLWRERPRQPNARMRRETQPVDASFSELSKLADMQWRVRSSLYWAL